MQRQEIANLATFGAATWVAAACLTLSAVVALRYVERTFGPQALGVFSAALVIQQILLTPSNYVTPLLFKRWIVGAGNDIPARLALMVAGSVLALAMAIGLISATCTCAWIGALGLYAPVQQLVFWVIVAAAFDSAQKILAVASNAAGIPWMPAVSDGMRLCMLGIFLSIWAPQSLLATTVLWVAAAVVAAVTMYVGLRYCEAARKRP